MGMKTFIPIIKGLVILIGSVLAFFIGVGYYLSGPNISYPPVMHQYSQPVLPHADSMILKIMTLNIAHGGKGGFNQIFLPTATIKSNLHTIANLLLREKPDLVALQEADGPSLWSGNFNHVSYLADNANYPFALQGEHVIGLKLRYGTAFLSKIQISDSISYTFQRSPPSFTKGFVVGTISWPGKPNRKIDVISLHLDFSRKLIRNRQISELITKLSKNKNPLIIMGDFNSGWGTKSPIRTLAEALNLKAYKPEKKGIATFPMTNKRIDWIMISREMDFLNYQVLPDSVSDHKGVLADLIWQSEGDGRRTL